jgi:hypothetical protein
MCNIRIIQRETKDQKNFPKKEKKSKSSQSIQDFQEFQEFHQGKNPRAQFLYFYFCFSLTFWRVTQPEPDY